MIVLISIANIMVIDDINYIDYSKYIILIISIVNTSIYKY